VSPGLLQRPLHAFARSRGGWVLACLALMGAGAGCAQARPKPTLAEMPPIPKASASLAPPETNPSPSEAQTPSSTPTPACGEDHGSIVQDSYPGHNVPGPDPILVYLPPCYASRPGPFPVLYLFHGKPFNETHWVDVGLVAALGAREAGSTDWIVVLPRVPEPLFSNSDGGPGSYEDEFMETVLPYVESRYRVRTDAPGRGIGGISRGGVWSLEIGLRHPDAFGLMLALSPALAVNSPRPAYDPLRLAATAEPLPAYIFLGAGTDDWARPATLKLAAALQARGSTPDLELVPGAHESATWQALLPAMLAFADASMGAGLGAR
jgi:enterochelin esterase-like enzyme